MGSNVTAPAGSHVRVSDLRGAARLAIDATIGLTDLVETMQHGVMRVPGARATPMGERATGMSGVFYRTIRGATLLLGGGIDAALAQLAPKLAQVASSAEREAVLAALNGVPGDHLAASDNPLAIALELRRGGQALVLEHEALAAAIPDAGGKILVLAHGLCAHDLQWRRNQHDHGAALAADAGFTPIYLRYNTGLHISTNGRTFADRLEALLRAWPVPVDELVIIGHSMGGLVARSACLQAERAGHDWRRHLRKLVFLGTPHHGAPIERGANWVNVVLEGSPYTAAFARLGRIRSAGITDLGYGSVVDEDWKERDPSAGGRDARTTVPLPEGVECYAVAASVARHEGDMSGRLLGDGFVPLESALGRHADPTRALAFPPSRQWIGYGMRHLDLLGRPEVYAQIRGWLA
jgi:pimeloyl-ACP methyl ester carboxylesterase